MKSSVPEPCAVKIACTVLMGGKLVRAYLSTQRLKPYQYLHVDSLYLNFLFFFLVIIKAPEDERPRPEQVEGRINSALEDRTRDCGSSLGRLGSRSERLIKLVHSWFFAKCI